MSIIAVVSLIISIATAIIALSITRGFEYELNKRILSIIPHAEIVSIDAPFFDWKFILNKIKKIPGIINASPYINFPGIIEFKNKWHWVYIKSINLIEPESVRNICITNFIEKESWKCFCKHKNQIVLGKNISDSLNIKTGDWINILFVRDFTVTHKLSFFKKVQVQVSGILNLHSQFDENLAIISLSDARNYCNNKVDVDGIEIVINNAFYVNQVIKNIKNQFNEHIQIYSWMDTYGYIYRDIQIIRFIIYLSVILIIGMSYFNIIAILVLSIKNKNNDIAILRALGSNSMFIRNIFLSYGLMMYLISSILGISIGVLVSLNITNITNKYINIFGNYILPKGIYFIDFIPAQCNRLDIFIILCIIFLLVLLTSWYISFKTNRIKLNHILK